MTFPVREKYVSLLFDHILRAIQAADGSVSLEYRGKKEMTLGKKSFFGPFHGQFHFSLFFSPSLEICFCSWFLSNPPLLTPHQKKVSPAPRRSQEKDL